MISALVVAAMFSVSCLDAIEQHFGNILEDVVVVQMELALNEIKIGPGIIYLSDIETRNFIHALIHAKQMQIYPTLEVLEAHILGHHWLELQALKAWRGFYFRYGPVCDW